MTRQYEKVSLTQSLEIFEDILDDIKDTVAINLKAKLDELPPVEQSDNETLNWVRSEVRKIEIEQITEAPLKIIRRITSKQYYQSVEGQADTNRITDEDIARAKEFPIEELYDGVLKKTGSKHWGICPFHHEKTGSFCVHDDNRWSCFGGCGHGDSIDYVMRQNNIDFLSAVRSLIK